VCGQLCHLGDQLLVPAFPLLNLLLLSPRPLFQLVPVQILDPLGHIPYRTAWLKRASFPFIAVNGYKQFRALREAAGFEPHVTTEHCRDGAYTAAVGAGVDLTQAKLLPGHPTGISDHDTLRRPMMVAGAVAAVERAYFDIED